MRPFVPLTTTPDLSQIERLRPFVAGRRCAVVGSAPLATPSAELDADEVCIPVNGGIGSVRTRPDVWFVGSKRWDDTRRGRIMPRLHREMLQQAHARTVGHIVLLRSPEANTEAFTLKHLTKIGCRYDSWSPFDKPLKRYIEGETCARQERYPCSSGLLAVAVMLWCGAEAVRLVGFNYKAGYQYLPKERPQTWWRDHIEADRRAIGALLARYPGRLSGALVPQVEAVAS